MISIIICSRKVELSKELSTNIKETVGHDYELIIIDNSQNKYSIFQAYNLGIERSNGNYLCFIHDDILFHTKDWGSVACSIFESDNKIGLIGVAGSKVKTKAPSTWWDCPFNEIVRNVIQHYPDKDKEICYSGFKSGPIQEVVVIDGLFMIARKVNGIRFSNTLTGFHNYDLNFSFEYLKHNYKIVVSEKILIEHFSLGTLNEVWVDSTYKIHREYNDLLPLGQRGWNKENEIYNKQIFVNRCVEHRKNKKAILLWIKLFWYNPIKKYHYRFWKKIIKNSL